MRPFSATQLKGEFGTFSPFTSTSMANLPEVVAHHCTWKHPSGRSDTRCTGCSGPRKESAKGMSSTAPHTAPSTSRTVTKKEADTRSTAACSPCPVALELAASGALRPDSLARSPARSESARFSRTVDALTSRRFSGRAGVISAEAMLRSLPRRPGGSDLGGSAGRPGAGDSLRVGPRPLLPSSRVEGGQAAWVLRACPKRSGESVRTSPPHAST